MTCARVAAAVLLAILAAPVAAQDRAPTVYAAVCAEGSPLATFQRVIETEGGWPVFYIPAPLLRRGSCEDVLSVPDSDLRYQTWAPTVEIRERMNAGATGVTQ